MSLWQRVVSFFRPRSQVASTCRRNDPVFSRFIDELNTTSFMLADIVKEQKDAGKKEVH